MIPSPIVLDGVSLRHGQRAVVHELTGCFTPGSLTALIGPNGAGKTTLLRAIAGLHPLAEGHIDRGGLAPAQIALLPQASTMDRSFPISCRDVVVLGATGRLGPFRAIRPAHMRLADAALAAVGLPNHAATPIGALSSGQFQRVLFARLMLQDAPVLLLDEPFNAVDATTLVDLLRIIRAWHAQGRTIVAVLHDLDLVHDAFPRTLLLAGSQVDWGPTAAALNEANRLRAGLSRGVWLPAQQHAL
ncbi:MAG: metal ABC transporter ATP-binding protein [Acetobacteraceae bacterium]